MLNNNLVKKYPEVEENIGINVITVLLIEDSLDYIFLIQEILTHSQSKTVEFELKSTCSLSSALRILHKENFDAILLDLTLSDASNLEAFDKINTLYPHVPIIVLTGLDDETLAIKAVRSGAQDYVVKGTVNSETLAHSIRYAIERKKAANILKELEQRRTNFIGMVSHELRTPLTVIRGYLEFLIQYNSLSPEVQSECFKPMYRNVIRLENLIKGVTELTEIDKGLFNLQNVRRLDLHDFLNDILEPHKKNLHEQLNTNSISNYSIKSRTMIEGDSLRLQQIIDNLMENAVRNTSYKKRKISCKIEKHLDFIRIIIKDNGAGIPRKNLEIIFKQFVSIPTEYYAGGSGIGLYISRKIAEAHGGTLVAHSKGKGKGSKFILELPRVS